MKDSDRPKLIFAVVILVAAAGVLAWYFGVFGGGAVTPENAPPAAPHSAGGPHMAPGAAPGK